MAWRQSRGYEARRENSWTVDGDSVVDFADTRSGFKTLGEGAKVELK
jgi:hypothetical protein